MWVILSCLRQGIKKNQFASAHTIYYKVVFEGNVEFLFFKLYLGQGRFSFTLPISDMANFHFAYSQKMQSFALFILDNIKFPSCLVQINAQVFFLNLVPPNTRIHLVSYQTKKKLNFTVIIFEKKKTYCTCSNDNMHFTVFHISYNVHFLVKT